MKLFLQDKMFENSDMLQEEIEAMDAWLESLMKDATSNDKEAIKNAIANAKLLDLGEE